MPGEKGQTCGYVRLASRWEVSSQESDRAPSKRTIAVKRVAKLSMRPSRFQPVIDFRPVVDHERLAAREDSFQNSADRVGDAERSAHRVHMPLVRVVVVNWKVASSRPLARPGGVG